MEDDRFSEECLHPRVREPRGGSLLEWTAPNGAAVVELLPEQGSCRIHLHAVEILPGNRRNETAKRGRVMLG